MGLKLIALGNILMKDDGIGIFIAKAIEEERKEQGMEVIYAETDFGCCISKLKEWDSIIILDAANFGKTPGDLTIIPFKNCSSERYSRPQHSGILLDVLKIYYPKLFGYILAIETKEITFGFGLSDTLQNKKKDIIKKISDFLNLLEEKGKVLNEG